MQAEAASRTGFSVSAIRKWRRMGLVADRKLGGSAGLERVEVRLEDVLARAAQQPDRARAPSASADGQPPPGGVIIMIDDLEVLYQRLVTAEARAAEAEAAASALRDQASFSFGQIAELRRQLRDGTDASETGLGPSSGMFEPLAMPEPTMPQTQPPSGAELHTAAPAAVAPPSRLYDFAVTEPPVPSPAPPLPGPAKGHEGHGRSEPRRPPLDDVATELRRIYARLDEYRREPLMTPSAERRHQRDLAEYDRVLLVACRALGLPAGLAEDEPVSVETRASLTRALARAGLDVRAGVAADHGMRRPRTPPRRRF